MQESAQAALFYARANASVLQLDTDFHSKQDIHVHVPGGATPKDGPSAGITIATALVSVLSGRPVSKDFAMTGEITLRGNVLPVGGLKEKALAALRYGIKKVIIPFENIKDVEEVPKEQRDKIKFIPVKHISEVLEIALLPKDKRTKPTGRRGGKAKIISARA
jgi:ATP-dependent Lon protease